MELAQSWPTVVMWYTHPIWAPPVQSPRIWSSLWYSLVGIV